MPLSRSPVPNPLPSFWTSEPRPLDDHRSTPTLPPTADIVIIGSGFSGVATAYHLLKDNPNPPSIVLLEARKICSGATGRNGGHVKPDTYFNVPRNVEMHGAEAAGELAAFEAANVYAVKELVEKEGIECDFHLTRAVDVYLDEGHAKKTEEAHRRLLETGKVDLSDTAFVSGKDAERVSGIQGAKCAFTFTAAHLYPAALVHALLDRLLPLGLHLHAHTPVTSISPSSSPSGLWTLSTPRGSLTAQKIIHATNAHTSHILPEYTRCITPIRGICSHITSPQGRDAPHLVNTYALRFDAQNFDYLIPRADGSIVVGGARQAFWHAPEKWFGSVRDDEMIEEAVPYFDGYMQRHFRGWEDSWAGVERVWTGIMGYSADYMPHVGEVPDKPGQYIMAGFNGHGMPQILLSSKGLAKMVGEGVPFEKTGVPRVFRTTRERVGRKDSPLEESLRSLWEEHAKSKL